MTAALEGGEWSAARPGRTLPPGKTWYPFYRRLGGPQSRSGRAENLVPTGIRSRTVQPVVSRYSDWLYPAHTHTHAHQVQIRQTRIKELKNKRPTWCHLLFYFTSYVLNMFRTLIYPSSWACDYAAELPHWSLCSWFVVCWRFGVVQPTTRIPLQPNHTETPTHIEPRTIRPMW